jgi:hypothetical protein
MFTAVNKFDFGGLIMKRLIMSLFGVLLVVCTPAALMAAHPLQDAIFHADFAADFNDTHGPDISTADYSWGANLVDVMTPMENSDGKGVEFSSSASMIKYGLGANDELRLQGALTYHCRVKFDRNQGWDFIMGRWGNADAAQSKRISYIILPGDAGVIQGAFEKVNGTGYNVTGYQSPSTTIQTGVFYDVFFDFRPKIGDDLGNFHTTVINAETGALVWRSAEWFTGITGLWVDDGVPFTIGGRYYGTLTASSYYNSTEPMDGVMEQVNVWNRDLTLAEMQLMATEESGPWIEPEPQNNSAADLDFDGTVDSLDLKLLAADWLGCSDPFDVNCGYDDYEKQRASEAWNAWRKNFDGFPIAAWGYFQRYGTEPAAEYTMYKNANLTMVMAPLGTEADAVAAGLKTIIGLWNDDDTYEDLHMDMDKLASYVSYGDANVVGYMLCDEPSSRWEMEKIGYASNYVYVNDRRDAIPMVDILPYPYDMGLGSVSWGGEFSPEYMQLYIDLAHPSMLLTDCYVIYYDGTTNEERFYNNYEIVREKTLANDIGFMGFVLNTEHGDYREASESDIYWQTYSLLAYGAKGYFYYNYRITSTAFEDGLVTESTGQPTSTYYYAQSVNGEVLNIGSVLMSLESTGVYHTGSGLPSMVTSYTNGSVTGLDSFSGSDFVIGEFENMDDDSDDDVYVMVVNKKHGAFMSVNSSSLLSTASLNVDSAYPYVYKYDTSGNLQQLTGSNGNYSLTDVGGGQGILLRLSADAEL